MEPSSEIWIQISDICPQLQGAKTETSGVKRKHGSTLFVSFKYKKKIPENSKQIYFEELFNKTTYFNENIFCWKLFKSSNNFISSVLLCDFMWHFMINSMQQKCSHLFHCWIYIQRHLYRERSGLESNC